MLKLKFGSILNSSSNDETIEVNEAIGLVCISPIIPADTKIFIDGSLSSIPVLPFQPIMVKINKSIKLTSGATVIDTGGFGFTVNNLNNLTNDFGIEFYLFENCSEIFDLKTLKKLNFRINTTIDGANEFGLKNLNIGKHELLFYITSTSDGILKINFTETGDFIFMDALASDTVKSKIFNLNQFKDFTLARDTAIDFDVTIRINGVL